MKEIDIVCYTSKLCNLRCRYCYELPLLGDPARMSFEDIERMFTNVALAFQNSGESIAINFQWHGGEPLLIPPKIYRRIFEIQRSVFSGSPHRIKNFIQSNFTVMDEERAALLLEFDSVGISLDLFSGLRVNKSGVCQEKLALENLDKVRAAGIPVGGITVLSRANLDHIDSIYQFYRDRRMAFRLLPLEKGLYATGQDFELGPHEVLEAFCRLIDIWLADDSPIPISPLDRFLYATLHANAHPDNQVEPYDPAAWTSVILVDTQGSVYTYGGRFEQGLGNLFDTALDQIFDGNEFRKAVRAAQGRMAGACRDCRYHGRACSGDPVCESQHDFVEQTENGAIRCIVARGILCHLEGKLRASGFIAHGTTHEEAKVMSGRILLRAA